MEFLLPIVLVVGAIVLIGITVVMVWPERGASAVGATPEDLEAPAVAMSETSLPPQGDRFEDQYTSATADLSAGGVAAALQTEPPAPVMETRSTELRGVPTQDPVGSTRGMTWPEADVAGERIGLASRSENFPRGMDTHAPRPVRSAMPLGLVTGAALTLLGAIGGAWLYARWQRERNKPINRIRARIPRG